MNTKEPKTLPVLLIEDDHEMRRSLRRQLEEEGFEVVAAADGCEGLRLLRDSEFAAVVSDHYMPGMDGVDVLRIARTFKPGIARVLSTSSDEPTIMARAVNEADVHAIAPKPCSTLGELVRGALHRHAAARAAKAANEAPAARRAVPPPLPKRAMQASAAVAPVARPAPQIVAPVLAVPALAIAAVAPPPAPVAVAVAVAPRPAPVAVVPPPAPAAAVPAPAPIAAVVAQPMAAPITSTASDDDCPVILAVDDDARWSRSVDRALRSEGYKVHTATSGAMALRAMEKGSYAMILLDMNMPKESGVEFARRVRGGQAGDRHRDVPIVFLTSDMTSESYEGSFEVGALRYVRKSGDANELIGVVQSVMHGE